MAYYSMSEFSVKYEDLLMQVGRLCDERSRDAALALAYRALRASGERFTRGDKIGGKEKLSFVNAIERVRAVLTGDERYQDQIADIEDYVESNLSEE